MSGTAVAAPSHSPREDLTKLGFNTPCGVATDSAGNYYVADGAASAKSVTIFDSAGNQITSFSTPDPFSGPCKLAVDASGNVYIAGSLRREVFRYTPGGAGFPPTAGTTYAVDTALKGNGALVAAGATNIVSSVAIDPATQNAYVAQAPGNEAQEYLNPSENYKLKCEGDETAATLTPASTNPEIKAALEAAPVECKTVGVAAGVPSTRKKVTFSGALASKDVPEVEVVKAGGNETAFEMFRGTAKPHIAAYEPNGTLISNTIGDFVTGAVYIGVDVYGKNGNVYVTDKANNKAYIFNKAGNAMLAEFNGSDSLAGAFSFSASGNSLPAVAIDQSNGHAYISDMQAHGVVDEFDGAGNFVSQLSNTPAFEEVASGNGVAVDNGASSPNKGNIYLTARTEANTNKGVFAFGPLIFSFPLKVTKTGQGAGTVTSVPGGINCGSTCGGEFEADSLVKLTASTSIGSALGEWTGCDTVNAEDECEVTMNDAREVSARFDSRPLVSKENASQVTATSARLEAVINPKGKATSYYFEYILEQAWLANGGSFSGTEPATKVPTSPISVGNGTTGVPVAIKIEGLEPSTAYRFRIVAENDIGIAEGERDAVTDEEIPRSFKTFFPPEVFTGDCPENESLRTGPSARLSDCRAYEQASPIDKNGGSIQGVAPAMRTAEDGSTITFESTTGIPGGSGAQNFPTYMAKRTSDDWSTTGLLPNASSGQRARVLGWTVDFNTVFDLADLFGGGVSMLSRSTASGTQTELVPHTLPEPEYAYVDTSSNGDTTIFEARPTGSSGPALQLTPEAAAGKPNVYAWDRNNPNELRLAGVLPDGETPPEGSQGGRGGSAEEYNRDAHRVSDDGSVFFNDLGDGQLYLRQNPTAEETEATDEDENCIPDPVLACTIHISATQKDNGRGPDGRDAAGPQSADFQAASPDGTLITFTSTEKLTNDANTGPEPEAATISRAKATDGDEKKLDFLSVFAKEIAIDEVGQFIYWTDPLNGRIGRAKLDGSERDDGYITGLGEPLGITVINEPSAEYIFWTDRGELTEKGAPQADKGVIGRSNLDGTNVIPSCYAGITNPRSVAASQGSIYWTMPEFSSNVAVGDVDRADLDCNDASLSKEFIADREVNGDIAVNESKIYTSAFNKAGGLSYVTRFTLAGVQDEFLAAETTGVDGPLGLALSDTHLYWADADHERVGRSDLDGGSGEFDFVTGAGRAEDPAIGGEHLFWSANQTITPNPGKDLYQLDRDSGLLTDLAPDSTHPNGTEVLGVLGASEEGSHVYFAANGVPDGVGNSPNEAGEDAALGNCKGNGFAAAGTCNLYVAYNGQVDFIARVDVAEAGNARDSGDAVNWAAGRADLELEASGRSARVSDNGQILVFRSSRRLTEYDNQGPRCAPDASGEPAPGPCLEFYRFDLEQRSLNCLSCNPRGEAPEGPATLASLRPPNVGAQPPAATLSRNLSGNGNRFFFETPDALVAEDTNGVGGCPAWGSPLQQGLACQDVYEWEAPGTGSCRKDSPSYSAVSEGCIYLISTGKSKEATFFADADVDGDNVFIFTYERLVHQDKDTLLDAYDARVGGGLVSQNQVDPTPCAGDTCKGLPASPTAAQTPGSSSFTGPGNVKAPNRKARRCAKGKRKVRAKGKVRCVPKVKRRKRTGNKSRGTGR